MIFPNRFRNFDDNGMDRTQTLGYSSAGTPIKIWVSGRPSQVRQTPWRKLRYRQRKDTGRLGSSYATCQRILREDSNMRRITAKFMSQFLAEENPLKFTAAKTWMWSSILLPRMIWPLVISSRSQEQKTLLRQRRFHDASELHKQSLTVLQAIPKRQSQWYFQQWHRRCTHYIYSEWVYL